MRPRHELFELTVELRELDVDLLELLVVLHPLDAELGDECQDLIARLLDHEVVVGLADHAEECEQRQRRTHHDALAHRFVDQRRIGFVDETGELLVGQEHQHVVDRLARRLTGVVATCQLADARTDVAQERRPVRLALAVATGVEVAQVAGHGAARVSGRVQPPGGGHP